MSTAHRQRAERLGLPFGPMGTLTQNPAAMDRLRLVDKLEASCASLYDSFSALPNVEIRHGTLDQYSEGVDCIVLPIYDRRTENNRIVTSLLPSSPSSASSATTPASPPTPAESESGSASEIDSERIFGAINDLYVTKSFGDGILPLYHTYWLSTGNGPQGSTSSAPGSLAGSAASSSTALKFQLSRSTANTLAGLEEYANSTGGLNKFSGPPLVLAVTLWQLAPAVTPETHIAQAFRAVLVKVHEHNQQVLDSMDGAKPRFIRTLLSPLFMNPCVLFSSEVAAECMATVYRQYLKAMHILATTTATATAALSPPIVSTGGSGSTIIKPEEGFKTALVDGKRRLRGKTTSPQAVSAPIPKLPVGNSTGGGPASIVLRVPPGTASFSLSKFRVALAEGKLRQRGFKDVNEIKELINIIVDAATNNPTVFGPPYVPPSPRSASAPAPEEKKDGTEHEAVLALAELNHLLRRPQGTHLMWTRTVILQVIRDVVLKSSQEAAEAAAPLVTPGRGRLESVPVLRVLGTKDKDRGRGDEKEEEQPIVLTTLLNLAGDGKFLPFPSLSKEDVVDLGQVIGRGGAAKVRRSRIRNSFLYSYSPVADVGEDATPTIGSAGGANDGAPEARVALKEFDPDIMIMDASLRTETFREVAVMSICEHPRLVTCRAARLEGKEWWVVSDLADCDLRGLLDQEPNLSGPLRLRIARQMAEGLTYLHSMHLIHRDLKSPNVLVFGRESQDTLAVKIADFGLCRVVDKTMTMTQGTQLWRAPEVIGRCDYTKKADVYSFGIILWELMTGELPFSEHDKESSMVFDEAICKGRRPTIPKGSEKHPYVQLMQECWDKNPASRPHFADILTRVSAVRSMPERVNRPGRK